MERLRSLPKITKLRESGSRGCVLNTYQRQLNILRLPCGFPRSALGTSPSYAFPLS